MSDDAEADVLSALRAQLDRAVDEIAELSALLTERDREIRELRARLAVPADHSPAECSEIAAEMTRRFEAWRRNRA
jgi:uncharacterized protein involved in exopolysaccharide biosynthesis